MVSGIWLITWPLEVVATTDKLLIKSGEEEVDVTVTVALAEPEAVKLTAEGATATVMVFIGSFAAKTLLLMERETGPL